MPSRATDFCLSYRLLCSLSGNKDTGLMPRTKISPYDLQAFIVRCLGMETTSLPFQITVAASAILDSSNIARSYDAPAVFRAMLSYTVYHLTRNPKTTTYYVTKTISEAGQPRCKRFSKFSPVTFGTRSPFILGRYSIQLRKSCASMNMVYS
jgi:hypothetical protein